MKGPLPMALEKDDLSRLFFIDVDAGGNVTIRKRGSKALGLPVFSTNQRAVAKKLIVRHCRLARDGSGIYTLNNPPKSVDDLGAVTDLFRATYQELIREPSNEASEVRSGAG